MQPARSCPSLTQSYIHSVKAFEEEVQQYCYPDGYTLTLPHRNPQLQPSFKCGLGPNPSVLLSLTLLRHLHCENYTMILASDRLIDDDCNQRHLILVVEWDHQPRNNKYWVDNCTYKMTFTVAGPCKLKDRHLIYFVPLTHVNVSSKNTLKYDHSAFKLLGKKCIQNKKYSEALIAYEIALGNISDPTLYNTRAILYTNSSVCFYEMRVFDNALIYAQLANQIDSNYTKGFFRKLTSLLQLKKLQEIPHCLLKLWQSPDMDRKEMESIQIKYYNYLANSIGLFNWKEIFKNDSFNTFGSYTSQKVSIRKQIVRVQKQIKPFELILFTKPIIHSRMFKKAPSQIIVEFVEQILKCCRLQSTFNEIIDSLPSPQLTLQCDLKQISSSQQILLQKKHLWQKVESNIIFERTIRLEQKEGHSGIYPLISHIPHSCEPNSSILTIKGAIALFAFRPIKPNQSITLDFVIENRPNDRKNLLKSNKNIKCECQYCTFQPLKKETKNKATKENKIKETSKLRKVRIWETILNKEALKSKEQYRMTLENYAQAVQEEPTWDALLNLAHITVNQINEQVRQKCKGVIIKAFCQYFRVNPGTAEEILVDMRK